MTSESDRSRRTTDLESDNDSAYKSLERFNAFSDGVFAIAITLLVLELSVPVSGVAILPALKEGWHEFLGYLISFAFIGGIWFTHSGLTKVMKLADNIVFGLNLVLLLLVALLPFSTSLMVTHINAPDVLVGVVLYGFNVLLASLTLSILIFYILRRPTLVEEGIAEETLFRTYKRRWYAIGINILALLVAFIAPLIAVGLYLLMSAIFLLLPFLGLHRNRHRK